MIRPLNYRNTSMFDNNWYSGRQFTAFRGACLFCGTQLQKRYDEYGLADFYTEEFKWESWGCPMCGWWWSGSFPNHSFSVGGTIAAILHKTSDLPPELVTALTVVRDNTKNLFEMPPTKFEHFVGDILREFYACEVIHCGKSHDGGIDLMIIDSNCGQIPVQVKRRLKPGSVESVSLVREFRGAMLLAGHDRGKIVSTADHFSEEAVDASIPKPHHLAVQEIDLVDCRRLLDIMKLLCNPQQHIHNLRERNVFPGVLPGPDVVKRIKHSLKHFSPQM